MVQSLQIDQPEVSDFGDQNVTPLADTKFPPSSSPKNKLHLALAISEVRQSQKNIPPALHTVSHKP